jgi:serine/threonine protein kinase
MVGGHETKRAGPWTPSPPATTLPAAPLSQGRTDIDPDLAAPAGPSPSTGISEGQILRDRYRILERIGSGGMGDVWKAEHVVIGRPVAIKVLGPGVSQPQQAESLMREARAIAALRHPSIVDITDFGYTTAGAPYLVMELLQGQTLKQVIARQGHFSWSRARSVLVQLTDALAHVHRQGIIHRDLKPDNVFVLGEPGQEICKIIDFGIAKLTVLDADAKEFTRTDMVFGTPAFMGPEQARGEAVDHRTDVYALGCVAYQMLTGKHPFPGATPTEVLYKQLFEHPEPMRTVTPDADVTPEIEAVVMMAMRKTPALRFPGVAEMRAAIEAVGTGAARVVVPEERLPTPSRRAATRFATAVRDAPLSADHVRQPAAVAIVVGILAAAGAGYLAVVASERGPTEEIETTPALHGTPPASAAPHQPTFADTTSEPAAPVTSEGGPTMDVPAELDETPDVDRAERPGRPRDSRRPQTDRPEARKDLPSKPDPIAPAPHDPDEKQTPKAPPPARPDRKPTQDGDLVDPFPGPAAG